MAFCGINSLTLTDIHRECRNNLGGVKDIWIISEDNVNNITLDDASETVKTITLAESATFSHWQFNPETASMNSTLNLDNAAGTLYVSTELALQFSKMESVKRLQIKAATIGNFKVVVRDNNDKLFLLGYDNPVYATAATATTGTAMADLNGYTMTLTDLSKDIPMEISMTSESLAQIGIVL